MLLRRVTTHVKAQDWTALFLAVISFQAMFFMPASANMLSSDELPQYVLEACDMRAMPYGGYDKKIAASVEALTDMGAFETAEFYDVKIGWCDLREAQGPAATTSCAGDTILLDSGYAKTDQSLVRNATLAHEMKHVLQHRAQKASHGDAYCDSDQYASDKGWMEAEADAFGDGVAELFFTGRAVEIRNECANALTVYLEADHPISANAEPNMFITAAPNSSAPSQERAVSKFFKIYAEIASSQAREPIRGGASMPYKRFIGGRMYGLQQVTLNASSRAAGPFYLTLSCPSGGPQ